MNQNTRRSLPFVIHCNIQTKRIWIPRMICRYSISGEESTEQPYPQTLEALRRQLRLHLWISVAVKHHVLPIYWVVPDPQTFLNLCLLTRNIVVEKQQRRRTLGSPNSPNPEIDCSAEVRVNKHKPLYGLFIVRMGNMGFVVF